MRTIRLYQALSDSVAEGSALIISKSCTTVVGIAGLEACSPVSDIGDCLSSTAGRPSTTHEEVRFSTVVRDSVDIGVDSRAGGRVTSRCVTIGAD